MTEYEEIINDVVENKHDIVNFAKMRIGWEIQKVYSFSLHDIVIVTTPDGQKYMVGNRAWWAKIDAS